MYPKLSEQLSSNLSWRELKDKLKMDPPLLLSARTIEMKKTFSIPIEVKSSERKKEESSPKNNLRGKDITKENNNKAKK